MLSKFSVKKPYTVVVGVVLIIVLGVVSFTKMTVDLLPSMNLPYAIVMTTYPGASPEQIEEVVTKPVEQTMATVSNIKNIMSMSSENASTVMLEFEQTANMDSATIEMRESLDQIKGFWPDEVTNPMIIKLNPDMMPVLVAAVSADAETSTQVSKTIEDEVIPEIESVEGVASVSAVGNIEETVEITLNDDKIDEIGEDIKAEMKKQLDDARNALNKAKKQVKSGKSALESGKKKAAAGMEKAESQVSVKSEELKQAQLELSEKRAELNVQETQLDQSLALVSAGKAQAQAQLESLTQAKNAYDELKAKYDAMPEGTPGKDEIKAQLAQMEEALKDYDSTYKTLTETIKQLDEQEKQLTAAQAQLAGGKDQLEKISKQVNDGALSLAQARGKLASAQLEAAVGIGEGAAQLAAGESALKVQEEQLKSAEKETEKSVKVEDILSADTVKTMLQAQNFSMPAGYVEEDGIDYLVRVGDKFKSLDELKNFTLLDMEDIDPVKLSDVAVVELVNDADETYAKINGKPGIVLSVQKQTGYSTGDVSGRVLERFEQIHSENNGINTVVLMDQGVYIDMIVNSVLQNLLYGAVLAIIILLLFLKSLRSTFVIACSIPISIMTALVAMYFSGITLNIISLSGLALGVGMLVDNSIVVIENIYRMRNEEGASAKAAAMKGAQQVSGAIMASTLTTICVFLPIVFTEGITRQLFVDMGLTIAYSLLASLLVALTVVPMMSAGLLRKTEQKESRIFKMLKRAYGKLLAGALRVKVLVLLGALGLFVGSVFLAASNGTEFMPQMESTQISMTLETEDGTSLEDTAKEADKVMDILCGFEDIEDVGALVSSSDMLGTQVETNVISFYAITKENPSLSNAQLKKKIEKETKDVNGELTVIMSNMDMSALGSAGINVEVKGRDLDRLQEIARDVKKIVEDTKGTQNVSDGTEDNTNELRIVVNKDRATKEGLTVAQVYQELYAKLAEPSSAMTLGTDTQDYDVFVKEDENEDLTREDIRKMKITVTKQDGTTKKVKLSKVVDFVDSSGLQSINRKGQTRYMSVTAEIEDGDNIGLVSNRVKDALKSYDVPEGYEVEMTGEDETINEAMVELFKMLALALLFMYLIMVAQFQSLRSPFIIMFTVPLAFTGGLLALWIADMPVSVIAMVGFVMLSGIIVNNGIVFIDYTNQLIGEGKPKKAALIEAGRTRMRPIVMTALTTILGLCTMAVGVGMGSDMVQPMAVVTIGGLIYGTVLTLFVVPCIFDLFHRKEKARLREGIERE
ncbi:MAG: efflux RND transporter permease subunit [Dorea sp.]|jgi:CzcA family heavy metal efflux pump|nr:efflux RND transporter permease subunit [Dorea sp.]